MHENTCVIPIFSGSSFESLLLGSVNNLAGLVDCELLAAGQGEPVPYLHPAKKSNSPFLPDLRPRRARGIHLGSIQLPSCVPALADPTGHNCLFELPRQTAAAGRVSC